jgi:hypothetical protein
VTAPAPIYRAPMRARDRDDVPEGAGAEHGLRHGLVGTGDALDAPPDTIGEAVAAATDRHGDKAGRMLRRFADLPAGTLVWARDAAGRYHLGRIAGPWRYDDSADARRVGIHHVRPATWLPCAAAEDEVPAGVAQTFGRGGRNLQRIHDEDAERETVAWWDAHAHARTGTDDGINRP